MTSRGLLSSPIYLIGAAVYNVFRPFRWATKKPLPTAMELLSARRPERNQIYTVASSGCVYDALSMMLKENISIVVVVDDLGKMKGVITESDYLRRVALPELNPRETSVLDVMTPAASLAFVYSQNDLDSILGIMAQVGCHHIPVLSPDGSLEGILTLNEVVGLTRANLEERKRSFKDSVSFISDEFLKLYKAAKADFPQPSIPAKHE